LTVPPWLARHLGGGGPLESWTLAVLVAVGGAAALVGGVILGRRRRRSQPRGAVWSSRAMLAGGALALVVATGVGVNAYVGYVPSLGAAVNLVTGRPAAGASTARATTRVASAAVMPAASFLRTPTVTDVLLPSRSLGMPNGNAYVYLPKGYDPRRRYPVLYLLCGGPGAPSDWLYAGNLRGTADALVRQGYIHPFIIVMPRISPTWSIDYEGLNAVHGPQVMTYLTRVVVPAIDARYSTVASRWGRAIGGFSAGADAALNTALHHQSMFSAVAAIDPEGMPGAHANWVLADNARLIWQNSPIDYIPSLPFGKPMAFYLSAGRSTGSGAVRTLTRELRSRRQTVVVHNEPGYGHTWVDARHDLPYLLQFVSQAFGFTAHPAA
jgi:enterochelin esterase-like enzyme